MRGKLIVIEGTDSSGKATQSNMLIERLNNDDILVSKFSFPAYDTPTGKIVGGPYLGKPEIGESYFGEGALTLDPKIACAYYAADRRYNFLKEIEDELYKNDIVLLDRYTTSNMGHQAAKAKSSEERDKILRFIETLEFDLCELPRPDKVIFLHMPFEAAKELRKDRKFSDGNESNEAHLRNAEKTYVDIAQIYNWDYINCLKTGKFNDLSDIKSIDEISEEIIALIEELLDKDISMCPKMTRF